MGVWINTLLSIFLVSLLSLIGAITLIIQKKRLNEIIKALVSFSAGALLGGAFIHLMPEIAAEIGFGIKTSMRVLYGIFFFLMMERIIQWRHCHIPTSEKHPHPFGYMNLIGDALHNFTDGMIIAGSYLLNTHLGITTTIAVIMHEIPQELGDFGVLLHAGFSERKALLLNFASAITAIAGGVLILLIGEQIPTLSHIIIPLTAGGFIYIAGTDLIPEMQKECKPKKSILQIITFILGISLMYGLTLVKI